MEELSKKDKDNSLFRPLSIDSLALVYNMPYTRRGFSEQEASGEEDINFITPKEKGCTNIKQGISHKSIMSLRENAFVKTIDHHHYNNKSHVFSPRRLTELQGALDISQSNTAPTTSTTVSYQLQTLLGSSCDENSDNEDDDGDNLDQTEFIDSGTITSRIFWTKRNDALGRFSPTSSNGRSTCEEEKSTPWITSRIGSSLQPLRQEQGSRRSHLSRSGSSFNCSTMASISGLSTPSSVSKVLKAPLVDDETNSPKSSVYSAEEKDETRLQPAGKAKISDCRHSYVVNKEKYNNLDSCLLLQNDSWSRTAPKTARESTIVRTARRNSLELGASTDLISNGLGVKVVECKNEATGRLFQMVLKTAVGRPSVLCTQTQINVIETSLEAQPVLFTIRHSDQNLWGRQMNVHKDILLACRLVGIDVPKDIDIPFDSRRVFDNTDNIQHMNTYLERIVPHIKLSHIVKGVQLYWWKAVGNGLAVLQNHVSGKLILLKNYDKTIASAVDRICLLLNCENLRSPNFWKLDPSYPTSQMVKKQLADSASNLIDLDDINNLVTRVWGSEERVSPLETDLIVKVHPSKFLRYSVGTNLHDPKVLLLQVHLNEPLSRGMNAYPVCMFPMVSPSLLLQDLRLTFLQAVCFLKKLFDVNVEVEKTQHHHHQSNKLSSPVVETDGSPSSGISQLRIFDAVGMSQPSGSELSTKDLKRPEQSSSRPVCISYIGTASTSFTVPTAVTSANLGVQISSLKSLSESGRQQSTFYAKTSTLKAKYRQVASGKAISQGNSINSTSKDNDRWKNVCSSISTIPLSRMQSRTPASFGKNRKRVTPEDVTVLSNSRTENTTEKSVRLSTRDSFDTLTSRLRFQGQPTSLGKVTTITQASSDGRF